MTLYIQRPPLFVPKEKKKDKKKKKPVLMQIDDEKTRGLDIAQ
jgi:hypothetical protein